MPNLPINENKWDADTLARQPFVVEQEGDERILRRYFASPEGHPMKRDIAIFCNWNGSEDQKADEAFVLAQLNRPRFLTVADVERIGAEAAKTNPVGRRTRF